MKLPLLVRLGKAKIGFSLPDLFLKEGSMEMLCVSTVEKWISDIEGIIQSGEEAIDSVDHENAPADRAGGILDVKSAFIESVRTPLTEKLNRCQTALNLLKED